MKINKNKTKERLKRKRESLGKTGHQLYNKIKRKQKVSCFEIYINSTFINAKKRIKFQNKKRFY